MGARDRLDRDLLDFVESAIATEARQSLDRPHVIHVYDRVLRAATVLGPFPDAVTALCFAERFVAEAEGGADRSTLRADVLALEAPEGIAGASRLSVHRTRLRFAQSSAQVRTLRPPSPASSTIDRD